MIRWVKQVLGIARSRRDSAAEPSESLPAIVETLARKCWIPVADDGDGPPEASKLGGIALIPDGQSWPTCGNCRRPSQLFLQLRSSDLPAEAGQPFGEGVFQLFYCTSSDPLCEVDADAFFPFSRSVLARVIPLESVPKAIDASPVQSPFPGRQITGWTENDDYPHSAEIVSAGANLTDGQAATLASQGYPRQGDKLLGWPAWVQDVDYPRCRDCNELMRLVFQIESEDNLPYMFGDSGRGHVYVCPEHANRLAFGWACH